MAIERTKGKILYSRRTPVCTCKLLEDSDTKISRTCELHRDDWNFADMSMIQTRLDNIERAAATALQLLAHWAVSPLSGGHADLAALIDKSMNVIVGTAKLIQDDLND